MNGQIVHIGLMQGTALLPWMLVALDGIVRRLRSGSGARGLLGYVILLGVSCGLATLAGDPRAVSSAAIVLLVYLIALVVRDRRRAGLLVGAVVVAAALGAFLSAMQWLPGLGFLHSSQRGVTVYDFFGTGLITPSEMGSLLVAPFLLGGNSNFGMPVYGGVYNLPELTIGVGIMALVAFMAYLPELARSLFAYLRGDRARSGAAGGRRPLGVWYVLAALGVVLGLGIHTPLGHLLVHIPLYGGQRLQNRNVVMLDLALVVLLAYLVEDLFGRRPGTRRASRSDEAGGPDRPDGTDEIGPPAATIGGPADATTARTVTPLTTWTSRLLALAPVLAAFALVGWAYAAPVAVELHFGFAVVNPSLFDEVTPYLASQLTVAGAIGLYVLFHRRLPRRAARFALVALILADLGIYVAFASYATAPSSILGQANPWSTAVARYTGPNGRFAIYNPLFQQPSPDAFALLELGVSDMNVLQGNASVQGYGSIVDNTYEDATDTHKYEDLDTSRLDDTTFDTLDTRALVTLPTYFQEALPPHSAIPVAGAPAVTATGAPGPTTDAPAPAPGATGPWTLEPHQSQTWLLAAPETVVRLSVVINPQLHGRPPRCRHRGRAPWWNPALRLGPRARGPGAIGTARRRTRRPDRRAEPVDGHCDRRRGRRRHPGTEPPPPPRRLPAGSARAAALGLRGRDPRLLRRVREHRDPRTRLAAARQFDDAEHARAGTGNGDDHPQRPLRGPDDGGRQPAPGSAGAQRDVRAGVDRTAHAGRGGTDPSHHLPPFRPGPSGLDTGRPLPRDVALRAAQPAHRPGALGARRHLPGVVVRVRAVAPPFSWQAPAATRRFTAHVTSGANSASGPSAAVT